MESQKNDEKKETKIQTKNKKKNNKERKRLMSLFRGPKVEHKLFRKTTEEESKDIKQLIIDIMEKNSSMRLHQKKLKKSISDEKIPEVQSPETKSSLKLTNDLVLGLNSIIRSIEKKSIIGVILTNPLALQLEDNIIELCSDNRIPCLSVLSFDEMKSCLNISSLSAIAFKPNVVSNESVFHELYEKFRNILDINCSSVELKDVKYETEEEEKEEKSCVKPLKSETTIEKIDPLFKELYSKKSEDNYRQIINKYIKNSSTNQRKDEFTSQELLIKFSSETELYFPETKDLSKGFPKIKIILEEQPIDSNDNSFAQSLIESIECKSPQKNLKRKLIKQNERQGPDFKIPRIERLEPSSQKISQRKQQKQLKKQFRRNKKS